MEISQKIVLKEKGDSAIIGVKDLVATLSWTDSVDLDLYAIYQTKDSGSVKKKGFFQNLMSSDAPINKNGKVYYGSKGSLRSFPHISLDKDSGIGDTGGENEENLRFADLASMDHVLIVANVFAKPNANFANYNGKVTVKTKDGKGFEVPLTSNEKGKNWCVVAHVDNTNAVTGPRLINVNKACSSEPRIQDVL